MPLTIEWFVVEHILQYVVVLVAGTVVVKVLVVMIVVVVLVVLVVAVVQLH